MTRRTVYLAGPISGLRYGAATDWRDAATAWLEQYEIEALSPMRGKDYLESVGVIEASYEDHGAEWALSSASGFTSRDHGDCLTADIVLANFQGANDRVSIGTVLECAWAFSYRKQLIVVLDPPESGKPSLHDHPMIREIAGYVVPTLEHALHLVPPILNAGPRPNTSFGPRVIRPMSDFFGAPVPNASDASPVHFDA